MCPVRPTLPAGDVQSYLGTQSDIQGYAARHVEYARKEVGPRALADTAIAVRAIMGQAEP